MAGPWEKYAAPQEQPSGPWTRYAAPQPAPPPPAPEAPAAPAPRTFGQRADGLGASLFDGVRQGMAMVAGAPVDLINNAPRVANLLPGVDGVGPMTDNPIGGRDTIDEVLRGFGLVSDYEPEGEIERIANRVGEELGATAVPVAGTIAKATSMPVQAVNRMAAAPRNTTEAVASTFLQPAAVNPAGLVRREALYATGSGLGAGTANWMAGENEGALSDILGSLGGAGLTAVADAGTGVVRNLAAGATGNTAYADDVASAAVAERLINSSSDMQTQASRLADAGLPPTQLSTDQLVQALRRPAPVEEAVPGYRANIADRAQDPGLATLTYNVDARSPGARNSRLTANETVVNERMTGLAPEGNTGRFRTNLLAGVDNTIGQAQGARDGAQEMFDSVAQLLQPTMPDATARGSSMRSGLDDAYGAAQDEVSGLYAPLNQDRTPLDPSGLVESAKGVDMNLAPNDAKRFRPVEADTIQEMMPGQRAPLRETGLVNEFNRPIWAQDAPFAGRGPDRTVVPALPGEAVGRPVTTVPMSDISAIRTGLTDDLRAAQAAGQTQKARVLGQYIEAVDGYLDANMPEQLREALDTARAARRDVGERFERPGTALNDILSRREGGGFALDDSAVPGRIAQPDQGRLTDLRAALSEAGTDPRLRDGLADQVRSDVTTRGLLDKPQALGKYMADRQVLLSEFPELRTQLEQAGATRADLTAAEKAAADTTKRLTTPGRSAEASYLDTNVDDPGTALMRAAMAKPDRAEAVRDLLRTSNSPTAVQDLRSAFWEEVKRSGRLKADGVTGETRWNGKQLRALFDDPKFSGVAKELWADDPQDLANIKEVFSALASAEGSSRARATNTSGTAQSLAGTLDPALTASSIASRARSVSRGQLSPAIAAVDILGTWLRRRSAQVQSRAIDAITASVVNNPGLAADLLEKYNPATAAARREMLTQKYGVRATTLLNVLEEAEDEDPVLEAVQE